MQLPIYLDNHATTQVDPRVVEAMLPCFTDNFGNPASSSHPYGWKAKELVEQARAQVAALAGCDSQEVIFTSGATEAINLALKGIARQQSWSDIHIVTCVTEHSAVLDTCSYLESKGAQITRLPVDRQGNINLDELSRILNQRPTLLSLMHANNETGLIHPLDAIGELCKADNVLFHVDTAQSIGKIPVKFADWNIDFMSISGHKLYGPKGIGSLLVRRKMPPLRLTPQIHGGGHERGFRSGTLNVPGIVGLGKACEIARAEMDKEAHASLKLRDRLLNGLRTIPGLLVNGSMENRLPGNLNISLPGVESQRLLPALRDHISVSSGSACTSAHPRPSHVLAAMGVPDVLAASSLRFGIGRFNTEEEIDYTISVLPRLFMELHRTS